MVRALAVKARRLEFNSPAPTQKLDMAGHACNPSTEELVARAGSVSNSLVRPGLRTEVGQKNVLWVTCLLNRTAPASCPLTSTYAPWHMHTHAQEINKSNKNSLSNLLSGIPSLAHLTSLSLIFSICKISRC